MSSPAVPPVTPTVFWAQNATQLFLKLDVREARRETVAVKVASGTKLTISGTCASGRFFQLDLDLHGSVMPVPRPEVVATSVSVTLAKLEDSASGSVEAEWPRLLADGVPLDKNKIKVDWDRFESADLAEDAAATAQSAKEKLELSRAWAAESARISGQPLPSMDDLPAGITPEQAAALGLASRSGLRVSADPALLGLSWQQRAKAAYLVFYNSAVLLGLFFVLFLSCQLIWLHLFPKRAVLNADSAESARLDTSVVHSGGWAGVVYALGAMHARVGGGVYVVQALASLEIFHAAVGLIQGRVLPSFLLNGGRDIILYGVIFAFPLTHTHWSVGVLYLLWCIGDLSRYLYYLMALLTSSPAARATADNWLGRALTMGLTHPPSVETAMKIRYTLPLFLLPLGFVTELAVLWAARDSAALVSLGGGVSLAQALWVYATLAYLLGAPFLYLAVLKQRGSKLGKGRTGKGKTSSGKASSSNATSAAAAAAKKAT